MPGALDEIAWLTGLSTNTPVGRCEVTAATDFDREQLVEWFTTTDADVLHFVGMGLNGDVFVGGDPDEPNSVVSHDEIVDALATNNGVALVVLSACQVEATAEAIASTLGVTVLTHRGCPQDLHAAKLTEVFYPIVLEGLPMDLAIGEARRRLEREFPGQAPWATTVLFTGWPAARYQPPTQTDQAKRPIGDALPIPSEITSVSAPDLVKLMHETNLARLRTLSQQDWSPVAEQVADAGDALSSP